MTRALWLACVDMSTALQLDEPWLTEIKAALPLLPAAQIGSDGRLQEWRHQPADHEPGHRHISHLYGLYPSAEITPSATPGLAAAARESLNVRLANGGGHTGWSAAWVAACFARLGDGEAALGVLHRLLRDSTYPSMLGSHPPFQIDGSLGSPAAIAEMIVQSHAGLMTLFPALPKAWRTGKITGLRLRGGITVDIEWKNEAFVEAFLVSDTTQSVVIHAAFDIRDVSSRGVVVSGDSFAFKAGVHYEWKLLDAE
jgi:alpha-L-fucosidase 2